MSLHVVRRLLSHPRLAESKTVMLYLSLPDEVDTHTLVDTLLCMGKRVLLPVVVGEGVMRVCLYTGKDSLAVGAYGIQEPTGAPYEDLADIDVVVVPGMVFDSFGHRLGRGKGYYDRFLTRIPHAYKIGMCFDFQKVEHVPTDANDVSVDEVL